MFFLLGAEINEKSDNDGSTALHFSAREGHVDVVNALLGKGVRWSLWLRGSRKFNVTNHACRVGADINETNDDGSTPLDFATNNDHPEVVRVLRQSDDNELLNQISMLLCMNGLGNEA